MASLRSPLDLCDRLGLHPTIYQQEILQRFYENEDPLHVREIPAERTCNAAALCALWRLLRFEGTRCIVIAANRELENRFMGFLQDITTSIDPVLTSVCRWTDSKTLKVGEAAGHELRFMGNKPAVIQGTHDPSLMTVVLGARSSEPRFNEMMEMLATVRTGENTREIVVW